MDKSLENVKCPICSSPMKSRTGKFGVFWGCIKFPECKGTRDSSGRSKAEREEWKSRNDAYYEPEIELESKSKEEDKPAFSFNKRK